jgi:hypothetical protein
MPVQQFSNNPKNIMVQITVINPESLKFTGLLLDPFIKFGQSRIAFTTTGATTLFKCCFFNFALADPFAQHAAQRLSIHMKVID